MTDNRDNMLERSFDEAVEGANPLKNVEDIPAPLKTSTIPVLRVRSSQPMGATGMLSQNSVASEGENNTKEVREKAEARTEETESTKPSAVPETAAPTEAEPTEKQSVLIVEDTTELAEVIQATLENAGLAVEWVSHGSKGLERIKADTPDVLLLDIGLPDMTGWKMLEELRDWKKNDSDMPAVVVITAYGDPANRLIGKLQGVHSYLIKPFTSDEVERVVQRALNTEGE